MLKIQLYCQNKWVYIVSPIHFWKWGCVSPHVPGPYMYVSPLYLFFDGSLIGFFFWNEYKIRTPKLYAGEA